MAINYRRPAIAHGLRAAYASLPPATEAQAGTIALVTDLGQASTMFVSNGTYWRVTAPADVSFTSTSANGTLSASDQIIRTVTLPVGILRAGRSFSVKAVFGRAGTTDAATTCTLRLGTAGTTADAAIFSSALLTETNKTLAVSPLFYLTSATNVRLLGSQTGLEDFSGAASTVAYPVDVTVANVDSSTLKLSAGMQMAGTTDLPSVHALILTINP